MFFLFWNCFKPFYGLLAFPQVDFGRLDNFFVYMVDNVLTDDSTEFQTCLG